MGLTQTRTCLPSLLTTAGSTGFSSSGPLSASYSVEVKCICAHAFWRFLNSIGGSTVSR